MGRKIVVAMAVMMAVASASASAQLGLLFGNSLMRKGEADGAYQAHNQIRTYIMADPHDPVDLYGKAIVKAGEMTRDKGFTAFGVTKYNCSMALMNNRPISKTCYVIAIMLNDGEEAKPRGGRKVLYYKVGDVMAGVIARPDE